MSQPSIFTRVRNGDLPGEVLYQDSDVFVMMTIQPHNPGHCLVIPVAEKADLMECEPELTNRLMAVAKHMMRLEKSVYGSPRVALVSAGLEVPHTHLHVFPLYENADLNPARAHLVEGSMLRQEADKLRAALEQDPI